MKTFKKITILSLFVLGSYVANAAAIVVLSDNKDDYTQTDEGYTLKFEINASAQEIDEIQKNAESLSDRLQIATNVISDGKYYCVFTVTHQNQPEYVHKMMLSVGFNEVLYQGASHGLDKVVEVLRSFQ